MENKKSDTELNSLQIFTIIRNKDQSGVSGTGRVLDGVIFPNGKVVVCWRAKFNTVAVYESFEAFKYIHVDSHPSNNTEIIWLSENYPLNDASLDQGLKVSLQKKSN